MSLLFCFLGDMVIPTNGGREKKMEFGRAC